MVGLSPMRAEESSLVCWHLNWLVIFGDSILTTKSWLICCYGIRWRDDTILWTPSPLIYFSESGFHAFWQGLTTLLINCNQNILNWATGITRLKRKMARSSNLKGTHFRNSYTICTACPVHESFRCCFHINIIACEHAIFKNTLSLRWVSRFQNGWVSMRDCMSLPRIVLS